MTLRHKLCGAFLCICVAFYAKEKLGIKPTFKPLRPWLRGDKVDFSIALTMVNISTFLGRYAVYQHFDTSKGLCTVLSNDYEVSCRANDKKGVLFWLFPFEDHS